MDSSRPRSPGVVFGALALALTVLIGLIALTARQNPPPTIAEFAPQAVEQITDSPQDQSGRTGRGPGTTTTTPAPAPDTTTPTQTPVDVRRVRRCVGDPPRQIEDPQSPPCVPYWSGDNGGATSEGVDAGSVRIYIPAPEAKVDFYEGLRKFFNNRFEFYGRRLEFVYPKDTGTSGSGSPEQQAADAVTAKSQKVFASSYYKVGQGFYYHKEASRQKIVNVTGVYFGTSGGFLAQNRPYMWQYLMDNDEMSVRMARWACDRLARQNAVHAGGDLVAKKRAFGVLMQNYYDADPSTPKLAEDELRSRCAETSRQTTLNPVRSTSEQGQAVAVDPTTSTTTMLKYKDAGVTSIICLCSMYTAGALMKAATSQSYFPEWLLSTYGPNDFNAAILIGSHPPEQLEHAFGVTFQPRQVKPSDEPFWWG